MQENIKPSGRRGYHGAYWFWLGFNPRAIIAWAVGVTVGFLFTNTTLVTGPYSNAVGGVVLSWSSCPWSSGALLYFVLLKLFPESGPAVEPPLALWKRPRLHRQWGAVSGDRLTVNTCDGVTRATAQPDAAQCADEKRRRAVPSLAPTSLVHSAPQAPAPMAFGSADERI